MTPITTRHISLSSLVSATLLFSAGVLASNRVKHFIATRNATEPIPYVNVEYTNEGAFIDKQRYLNGMIGGPRCDWRSLSNTERNVYAAVQLKQDGTAVNAYLHSLPVAKQQELVYTALVRLARDAGTTPAAEADRIKDAVGFRWGLTYEKAEVKP